MGASEGARESDKLTLPDGSIILVTDNPPRGTATSVVEEGGAVGEEEDESGMESEDEAAVDGGEYKTIASSGRRYRSGAGRAKY